MLRVFGFERVGVLLGDLFFVDPAPSEGQEGAERGIRLEVRMLEPGELRGSIYSARPITAGRPVWRVDLLETVEGPPGSLNRAHHHPHFHEWEPGCRVFDADLSADPVKWVGDQLCDLEGLVRRAGIEPGAALTEDAVSMRKCVPEVKQALQDMLADVQAGELARVPSAEVTSARQGWL